MFLIAQFVRAKLNVPLTLNQSDYLLRAFPTNLGRIFSIHLKNYMFFNNNRNLSLEYFTWNFAQYQVISIDHRRDFIPNLDNFPLRILGISGTFTSTFRF